MPSEIGRAEKENYCIIPPTDGILKIQKKKTSEYNKKEADSQI